MSVKVEVWGDYALFSRPEMKVERVSYDVMTPSAARGILDAIYYHPGLVWRIDRIHVLNRIRFTNIRRNEVKNTASAQKMRAAMNGTAPPPYLCTAEEIQQRASLLLQDVRYVIEAHFDMTDNAAPSDNAGKFLDITHRRLERGQCYHQPYFGCREFPAHFRKWEGGPIPAIEESRELGFMLFDMEYSDKENITPMFFRARMERGVIQVGNCEVVR
jgi:CRISPR-associated protein Cas5d